MQTIRPIADATIRIETGLPPPRPKRSGKPRSKLADAIAALAPGTYIETDAPVGNVRAMISRMIRRGEAAQDVVAYAINGITIVAMQAEPPSPDGRTESVVLAVARKALRDAGMTASELAEQTDHDAALVSRWFAGDTGGLPRGRVKLDITRLLERLGMILTTHAGERVDLGVTPLRTFVASRIKRGDHTYRTIGTSRAQWANWIAGRRRLATYQLDRLIEHYGVLSTRDA